MRHRRRVTVEVSWELDPVPGWNYGPEDVIAKLQHDLLHSMPHYNPTVSTVIRDELTKEAS